MDAVYVNQLFCVFFVQKDSLCWQTIPAHLTVPIAIILTARLIYVKDVLTIVIAATKQDNAAHAA